MVGLKMKLILRKVFKIILYFMIMITNKNRVEYYKISKKKRKL
jgi:hypothetical protein